jgi:hypothetical protein
MGIVELYNLVGEMGLSGNSLCHRQIISEKQLITYIERYELYNEVSILSETSPSSYLLTAIYTRSSEPWRKPLIIAAKNSPRIRDHLSNSPPTSHTFATTLVDLIMRARLVLASAKR